MHRCSTAWRHVGRPTRPVLQQSGSSAITCIRTHRSRKIPLNGSRRDPLGPPLRWNSLHRRRRAVRELLARPRTSDPTKVKRPELAAAGVYSMTTFTSLLRPRQPRATGRHGHPVRRILRESVRITRQDGRLAAGIVGTTVVVEPRFIGWRIAAGLPSAPASSSQSPDAVQVRSSWLRHTFHCWPLGGPQIKVRPSASAA